ncbi:MAG: hypothetical protein ACUVX9_15970 [Anaerolineae bacterium]
MQTLSPPLLAAQRSLGSTPSVLLRVEDRELRWQPLRDDDTSLHQTAAVGAAGAVVRARISSAGTLDVQRLRTPDLPSAWQSWSTVLSGVAPASDVALSALCTDGLRLRLFCVRPDGAAYRLSCLQSSDGGQSWSAPADLITGWPSASACLSAANGALLYHDPLDGYLKLARRSGWDSGAWSIEPWVAGGSLPARHGLALGYAPGSYLLVTADEEAPSVRRLRTGRYDEAGQAFTSPQAIVPPGTPAAAFLPLYPSLIRTEGAWHLAYTQVLSGPLSDAQPLVLHSADGEHWSFPCAVPLRAYGPNRRAALVRHGGVFYLALERAVWRAADFDSTNGHQALVTADVRAYLVEEEPWHGRLLVEVHNPQGRYNSPGLPGTPAAPLRPLARAIVERGYLTARGEERVARTPYYIMATGVRRGGREPALLLGCEDGWGLLRRWRPDSLYTWEGRSIAWLLAEVVSRAAGLACRCDSAANWATVLPSFALAPAGIEDWAAQARLQRERRVMSPSLSVRGSGLAAVQALLARAGGAARWQANGSLFCYVPHRQAFEQLYTIGNGSEVLDALYGRSLPYPNDAAVFGEGVAAGAGIAGEPRRYLTTVVDAQLTTAQACLERAEALVHAGRVQQWAGWIETPCQCQLELGDLLTIADERASDLQNAVLRAAALVEQYEPARGAFITRVSIEGA